MGTNKRPRVSVYRSNKYFYTQIIDDENGHTLASSKGEKVAQIAESILKQVKEKKIEKVVFDRSGYKYHGKVKTLADDLRKGGLKF